MDKPKIKIEPVPRPRRALRAADFDRMNLPRDFWYTKIQSVPETVRKTVHRYLANVDEMVGRGAGLLLFGPPGVGKTGVAALICKEARACGFTVFFTNVGSLRDNIRNRVHFEEAVSVLDRCYEVDVLVLDQLWPEDAKDYVFGLRDLTDLLTQRGAHKKVTVITTQMDLEKIRTSMRGLLDAVQGCIVCLSVEGPNLRREQNQELKRAVLGSEHPERS